MTRAKRQRLAMMSRLASVEGWVCHYCKTSLVPVTNIASVCTWEPEFVDVWWLDEDRTTCGCGMHEYGEACIRRAGWRLPTSYEWPTTDHRTPKSRGGGDGIDNIVLACNACNAQKGARTEDEYRLWLNREVA